jgi:hypothetical protein
MQTGVRKIKIKKKEGSQENESDAPAEGTDKAGGDTEGGGRPAKAQKLGDGQSAGGGSQPQAEGCRLLTFQEYLQQRASGSKQQEVSAD